MSDKPQKPLCNSIKGEVPLFVNGQWEIIRLSIGAVRKIKEHFGVSSLDELMKKERDWNEDDIVVMVCAGLQSGSRKNATVEEVEDMIAYHEIRACAEAIGTAINLSATGGKKVKKGKAKGGKSEDKPFSGRRSVEGRDSSGD